ncbi:NHL repeat-containing protein [Xanthobacter versatilis]|uniref:NHL repeat-containing protein n=1 Tax=Xanthobacter autotrophicus (strain ATCC BAA-1158 / Py2) TaxID=78245 RepID=UPI003727C325
MTTPLLNQCADFPVSRRYGHALAAVFCALFSLTSVGFAGSLSDPDKEYPNIIPPIKTIGGDGREVGRLQDPRGVELSGSEIYVTDSGNSRIQIFDLYTDDVRTFSPTDDGVRTRHLQVPIDVAVFDGHVYVLDSAQNQIHVYKSNGEWLGQFGSFGAGRGQFNEPSALALNEDLIAVADTGNQRIQLFDRKTYSVITTYPSVGTHGPFEQPSGIALTPAGRIFVTDTHNNMVRELSYSKGSVREIRAWGGYGSYVGQLAEPLAIEVRADEVFVTDLVNHRVQVFNIGSPSGPQVEFTFARHPLSPREGNGRVHYPTGLAVSQDGNITVICESFENRCQIFQTAQIRQSYVFLDDSAWWDKYPRFHYGRRLKITRSKFMRLDLGGELMQMSEPDINRIVIFDVSGERPIRLVDFGGLGDAATKFNGPHGCGLNAYGELFVTDSFNHKVKQFDLAAIGVRRQEVMAAVQRDQIRAIVQNSAPMFLGAAPASVPAPPAITLPPATVPLIREFGRYGPGNSPYEFNTPSGGASAPSPYIGAVGDLPKIDGKDPANFVWVSDTRHHRIVLFDREGSFAGKIIGGYGSEPGKLKLPTDLEVDRDAGVLYVVEAFNQRGSAFDAYTGEFLFTFGTQGTDRGQFMAPSGVGVDTKGYVFVTDQGTQKVSRWRPIKNDKGKTIRLDFEDWFGDYTSGPSGLLYPQGVAIDSQDRVYVVNFGLHKGEMFTREGVHLRSFGEEVLQTTSPY